jgi:hypothetical protein
LLGYAGALLGWRIFLLSLSLAHGVFHSRSPFNKLLSLFDFKFIPYFKLWTARARVVNSQNGIIVLKQMLKIHNV